MGLFSGLKKIAPLVGTAVGAFYGGGPGAAFGSQVGGMLSGSGQQNSANQSGDWMDTALGYGNSAMNIWSAYNSMMDTKDANKRQEAMQKLAMGSYDNQLQGILMQNATAKQLADESWERNLGLVRENRQYNEWATNTAHQREVADLKNAGLNPILSGTGGMGAAAPATTSATATPAPVRSTGDAVTSAFQAFTAMADAMKANAATTFMSGAQTAQVNAQTQLTGAQQSNVETDTVLKNAQRVKTAYESANLLALNPKIHAEIKQLNTLNNNLIKQGYLTDAQTAQAKQTTANLVQLGRDLKMKGDISASELGKILEIGKRTTDVTGNLDSLIKIFKRK